MNYAEYAALESEYYERFSGYNRIRLSLSRWYYRLYHRLRVIGAERIPPGPAIIAANHGGGFDLDITALSYFAIPGRPIEVLIDSTWHFMNHWWGKFFIGSGIPLWLTGGIRYEYIDPCLREGGSRYPGLVAIFPEGNSGTFRKRNLLRPFYPGVIRLAKHYRVPIVPAAMIGFHKACPIVKEIPRDHRAADIIFPPLTIPVKLTIEFGEPFELSGYYGRDLGKAEERQVANEVVRPRLLEVMNRHGNFTMGE
ncbi:MAG: 1-acyl-sn-glycerol-3-phosphate acyltransferase [Spirochaetes bacterium]|nr:1-acyl-sn-glycerol-3-phosphate acyltransferase [Spirochaetota bacterium]